MHADKPHILIVDDDARLRDLIARYTWKEGFVPLCAKDTGDARVLLEKFEFDAVVLDVMMPDESGIEMMSNFDFDIPVLFLTALGGGQDRIKGLEVGADDYLTKPFEPKELVLRLRAIIKRTKMPSGLRIGKWRLNEDILEDGADKILLTTSEASITRFLLKNKGQIISREDLSKECNINGGLRAVDVQIVRLRRKLEGDTKKPEFLKTVRGKGYVLYV